MKNNINYFDVSISTQNFHKIYFKNKNPWKDVLEYLIAYLSDRCIGECITEYNMKIWLHEINSEINLFSKSHPYANGFYDGWELRWFSAATDYYGNLISPFEAAKINNTLTIVAVDCRNNIAHELSELAKDDNY